MGWFSTFFSQRYGRLRASRMLVEQNTARKRVVPFVFKPSFAQRRSAIISGWIFSLLSSFRFPFFAPDLSTA
jgi:hypothetical protein